MSHNMSDTRLAYLAGFFDGEGSISVGRRKEHMWYVVITVWNTDPRPLQLFSELFGGPVSPRKKQKEFHKQGYQWLTSSNKASRQLLTAILPYLIIKKERAELALELVSRPSIKGRPFGKDVEERALRDDLAIKIRALNQKGVSLEPTPVCASA